MKKYFIKYVNKEISVFEVEDYEYIRLRKKGEKSWNFETSIFWEWFKDKIEYENQPISFVVVYDDEFKIDDSINLSKNNSFKKDEIYSIKRQYENYSVKTFPEIELKEPKKSKVKPKKSISKNPEKITIIERPAKKTILDVFKKQTEEYENDKR